MDIVLKTYEQDFRLFHYSTDIPNRPELTASFVVEAKSYLVLLEEDVESNMKKK